MNLYYNLKQWIFEHTLLLGCMAGLGMLYPIGTVWYENARFIAMYLI